jgi:hypothetical protein
MTDYVTMMLNIITSTWKSILGVVDIHFVDTHRVYHVAFFYKRKTFTINKKEYAVVPSMVIRNSIYYMTSCAEPIKIEEKIEKNKKGEIKEGYYKIDKEGNAVIVNNPISMYFSTDLTKYYVDSQEYFLKMHNNVIDRLMISQEKGMLQNIFYGVIGIALVVVYIAWKINDMGKVV